MGLWDVFRFFQKPDIRFAGLPAILELIFRTSKFRFAGLPLGSLRISGYDDSVAMPGLPGTPADLPFWVGLFLRLKGR